jgi:hypothetical protein
VVRVERIGRDLTRLVLSCGHVIIAADPVKPKRKLPISGSPRKCYKCVAKVKPDVKLPKKKRPFVSA